jgi:hypothetical protein
VGILICEYSGGEVLINKAGDTASHFEALIDKESAKGIAW